MTLENSSIDRRIIADNINNTPKRIYFIGIGGVSMSSLARMMKEMGHTVFGSDVRRSAVTDALSREEISVFYTQNGGGVKSVLPEIVVYSLSTDSENGDYLAAVKSGAIVISRAQLLGFVADKFKSSVAVSGTHGKTTTTSFLAQILESAGKSPDCLFGSPDITGECLKRGKGNILLYENCEYKRSFLCAPPKIQLLLNLELDHTDYYKDIYDLKRAFLECADNTKDFVILCADCKNLEYVKKLTHTRVISYGMSDNADYRYEIINEIGGVYSFRLFYGKLLLGNVNLSVAGRHNLENAVAAIVTAYRIGIKFNEIKEAAERLSLPGRRAQVIGKFSGADVVYDYAHHPTEILATEKMLREMGYSRIAAVFSPHTYSRTASFMREFASALSKFELALLSPIYSARENSIPGVSSDLLAESINLFGGCALSIADENEAFDKLCGYNCILLMGAGDLEKFKSRVEENNLT